MMLRASSWRWDVAALVAGFLHPARAQDAIERPLTIYVAGTAGGGIDLYARLLGRHIGRHIPGKPTVTVQLMPGAGGIRAATFLAEQAPRDGTAIGTFAGGPILEPLIGSRKPGYDMSQFTMIGAVTKDVGLCMAWGASPFKIIDDVKTQQMVVAGTGAGSETDTWPIVLNEVVGTRFKLVTGYLGSQETILAIERGEAHGRCVFSYSALRIAKPDWLRERKINVLLLTALERHPDFPGVPAVVELVARPRIASCWSSWSAPAPWRGRSWRPRACRTAGPRCCGAPSTRPCRMPSSAPRRRASRPTSRRPAARMCRSWSAGFMPPRGR